MGIWLQRNVAVFLCGIRQLLGLQLLQGADDAETRVARFDDIVYIAILGCIVGVGKQLGVFGFLLCQELGRIFMFLGFLGIKYFYIRQ